MPEKPPPRKKLIEVALPLEAINREAAREKSIRHGHPSTLHLWWARRPLAACRAVLFASLVDDPESDPAYKDSPESAYTRRAELFDLIEELVKWENSNNPKVINAARAEIAASVASRKIELGEFEKDTIVYGTPGLNEGTRHPDGPMAEVTSGGTTAWKVLLRRAKPEAVNHFLATYAPPVLDPFAGGGSIPLEAQRLGLRAHASDLNPVPVLINKALIEIPPKFANQPPVHPKAEKKTGWSGAAGLAEDVRRYGQWMRDEAEKRIGHLYPKVKVTQAMADDGRRDLEPYVGQELTVIAWLWCRTVKCPNPGCGCRMPMARSFWLSKKHGKQAYADPIINKPDGAVRFAIKFEGAPVSETSNRDMAKCLFCGNLMKKAQLREVCREHGMDEIPLAIVAEGNRGRIYIEASQELLPSVDRPETPELEQLITDDKRWFSPPQYGLPTFGDLFTARQLTALVTFSDLVGEARAKALADATAANHPNPDAYADAVATYLALGVSRLADASSSLVRWKPTMDQAIATFGRQALPMVWDYAESNPFNGAAGDLATTLATMARVLDRLHPSPLAFAQQASASSDGSYSVGLLVSTDPPYYDNIGYADLSDFFYVWLRRSLRGTYPDLLSTMLTPKSDELIASPYRHDGSKAKAAEFFETGLGSAIGQWRRHGHVDYPTTIFYAFKQAETDTAGTASTGWETFLAGVIQHGFVITATWPMRTEMGNRMVGSGTNALASSIVLACVPRAADASMATRREFADTLRRELPDAIRHLQSGNVAPVDLAQASIGPGIGVFSRYSKVVNADGSPMSVREALQLINQVLDEALSEQESDFDAETRFALKWFEQHGMDAGPFGDAETLAKAMAVSVQGVVESGVAVSKAGKVRLLKTDELDADWNPQTDDRLTIWEVTQHLIRELEQNGEPAAAEMLRSVGAAPGSPGGAGQTARELAYRLYQTCERKKWAEWARSYNGLVVSWPEIERLSRQKQAEPTPADAGLFENE